MQLCILSGAFLVFPSSAAAAAAFCSDTCFPECFRNDDAISLWNSQHWTPSMRVGGSRLFSTTLHTFSSLNMFHWSYKLLFIAAVIWFRSNASHTTPSFTRFCVNAFGAPVRMQPVAQKRKMMFTLRVQWNCDRTRAPRRVVRNGEQIIYCLSLNA